MPNQPDGQAVRSWASLIAGTDGTNGQTIKTDTDGELQVDVVSIVPGTGATNLGKAEDAAVASGDVGVAALFVRNDNASTAGFTDGNLDYALAAVDTAGRVFTNGQTALDIALPAAVNPVAIGGRASTATPSAVSADGDAVWAWHTRNGARVVGFANTEGQLLASAARTATTATADQTNFGRGCHVIIKVTSVTDTPSVVPEIQGKDAVTGDYYALLTGAAIVGTGTTVLRVYPGITAVASSAASDMLPRTWRVNFTHADADSITYSVAYAVDL